MIDKSIFRRFVVRTLRLDSWHLIGSYEKNYIRPFSRIWSYVISPRLDKACNSQMRVIEVGCGLGDVIGSVSDCKYSRIGIDNSKRVVLGAKIMHPGIVFKKGDYKDVRGLNIGCLILVNFLHFISPQHVCEMIEYLNKNNTILMIAVDRICNSDYSEYPYEHDFESLLKGYYIIYRSRILTAAHGAGRYLEVYYNKHPLCESKKQEIRID